MMVCVFRASPPSDPEVRVVCVMPQSISLLCVFGRILWVVW